MITSNVVTVDLVDAMVMSIALNEYISQLARTENVCWGEKADMLCDVVQKLDAKILDAVKKGGDPYGKKSDC